MRREKPSKFVLFLDYEETSSGGGICAGQENDEWPDHNPVYYTSEMKKLVRDRELLSGWKCEEFEVTEDLYNRSSLYLVVVRHSDGDTFGSSHGHSEFIGLFGSSKEALHVKKAIESGDYRKGEYLPWNGYFNRLESVEIHCLGIWS